MIESETPRTGEFTAAELENSAPFDPDKRLRGEAGTALLEDLLERVMVWEQANEPRKRKRKTEDVNAFTLTLDVLLANLIALWLNRVDASRFLAVSFDANAYRLPLSLEAMRTLRTWMNAETLVEVAPGFRKVDRFEHSKSFGRRTRIRATPALIEEFECFGIERQSLRTVPMRGVLIMRPPTDAEAPPEVLASEAIIEAVNSRLASTAVSLPEAAWRRIGQAREEGDDEDAYRAFAGDDTAKVLRRIFSKNWDRGGRIYGGWWMHVPSAEREHIQIDSEPTVEWDYAYQHPSILFAREEVRLDFDPYTLAGVHNPSLRVLGKRTFQRLVNREGGVPRRAALGDKELLPPGMRFAPYLELYLRRLSPIAHWLGVGAGMGLQRADSDLAVEILRRMETQGIATLPVHDSFLVQERHSEALRQAMEDAYMERYSFIPVLRANKTKGDNQE